MAKDPRDAAALRDYAARGFAVLPGFLDPAVLARLLEATDALLAGAAELDADSAVLELDDGHRPGAPRVRRIKKPHRHHPAYRDIAAHGPLLDLVEQLVGPDIRLNHSKVNIKDGPDSATLDWHQDWAFAPHTNLSCCIASILLDEVGPENGPLLLLPGSHAAGLLSHHRNAVFVGAVDVATLGLDLSTAEAVTGPPGTLALHHPLALHGSGINRGGRRRRVLFLEYAAADAFPLFYPVEWEDYMGRIVRGTGDARVRLEDVPVVLPFPPAAPGSIYRTQGVAGRRHFVAA